MKIKSASIFLLVASIIWLIVEIYWLINGISEGWLDTPSIITRVLLFLPPISLIFLSTALGNIETSKSAEVINHNTSLITVGDWLVTFLIICIPIVGTVMMFVWAFGNTSQENKKTWAQAGLIFSLIIMVIYSFIMFVIFQLT